MRNQHSGGIDYELLVMERKSDNNGGERRIVSFDENHSCEDSGIKLAYTLIVISIISRNHGKRFIFAYMTMHGVCYAHIDRASVC